MNIGNKLRHYYGAYKLTLSGEITLASPVPSRLYELAGEPRRRLRELMEAFHEEYPFVAVEIRDTISEGRLCFFSYSSALADGQFLDHLQEWLAKLARAAGEEGAVVVTVNCNGQFSEGGHMKKFRFLNKGLDIQYKITDEYDLPAYAGLARSRYVRFAETAALVLILLWILYDTVAAPGAALI